MHTATLEIRNYQELNDIPPRIYAIGASILIIIKGSQTFCPHRKRQFAFFIIRYDYQIIRKLWGAMFVHVLQNILPFIINILGIPFRINPTSLPENVQDEYVEFLNNSMFPNLFFWNLSLTTLLVFSSEIIWNLSLKCLENLLLFAFSYRFKQVFFYQFVCSNFVIDCLLKSMYASVYL